MKRFILCLLLALFSITVFAEVKREGNTFEVIQTSQSDVKTYLNWKDKDGIVYPIYISRKGACYVKRISKKTGKEYKYYLPKNLQETIKKELKL